MGGGICYCFFFGGCWCGYVFFGEDCFVVVDEEGGDFCVFDVDVYQSGVVGVVVGYGDFLFLIDYVQCLFSLVIVMFLMRCFCSMIMRIVVGIIEMIVVVICRFQCVLVSLVKFVRFMGSVLWVLQLIVMMSGYRQLFQKDRNVKMVSIVIVDFDNGRMICRNDCIGFVLFMWVVFFSLYGILWKN